MWKRIQTLWNNLPKTIRVFVYLAVSTILAEALIELSVVEQVFIVRILSQLINLAIVMLESTKPAIQKMLK